MIAAILHRQKNIAHLSKALPAIVVALCMNCTNSFAQMKVGNNPTTMDASSMLEIEATNQGILLPRISLSNITTWGLAGATPINGMFVYNSNAATTGGSGIGIYYWANLKWNYVQNGTSTNTAWLLTGNAATTPGTYAAPGTNFIGTTDGVDFAIRTTNAERMRIGATGQIGINQNFSLTNQLAVSTAVAANTAILGQNTTAAGTGGNGIGVYGISAQATNASFTTNGYGVVALNSNTNGTGLYAGGNNVGLNYNFLVNGSGAALVGTNVGAFGYSEGANGMGLYGNNTGATGFGVVGESDGAYGIGVYGVNDNTTQFQTGVFGEYNPSGYGVGVAGIGYNGYVFPSNTGYDIGVYGSANDYGVYGFNNTNSIGVFGNTNGTGYGVYGQNTGTGIGVFGYSQSTGIGVYGTNNNATSMGVLGENTNTSGTAIIGFGNNIGGSYLVNGSGGAFTGSSTGLWAYLPTAAAGGLIGTDYTTGSYGMFARADYYRTANNNNPVYHFAVYGEKVSSYNNANTIAFDKRVGGVLGTMFDNNTNPGILRAWGSLGYKTSANTANTEYGVYSSSAVIVNGTGRNDVEQTGGFGLGAYGGIMGGWIRGRVYGMNIKGERYGLYIDGYSYSNKPSIQLIDNGSTERTVAYNVSSLSADVYAHGKGKMVNGKAQINFDRDFQNIIDANDLAVTVTPIGESNGIHLVATNGNGFSLQENKNADNSLGTSNAEFTWIAVGKRKDVKTSDIANEVLASNFDKNMEGVMFNENDKEHNAGGMEWTGNGLKFYPVENAENPVVGNKSVLSKAVQKILPTNDLIHGIDSANRKTPEINKKKDSQKSKFLIDKKSQDKNNQSQKDMKKD